MKKTLLVFGVSGFIGTHLLQYLKKNIIEPELLVIGVVSTEKEASEVDLDNLEIVNTLDEYTVQEIIKRIKPDYIINLIGLFHAASYHEFIQTNVEISRHILEAVLKSGALKARLLFMGSAAEYGAVTENPIPEQALTMPVSLYGLSKVFQTHLIRYYYQAHGVQSIVARTFNLTGEGISASLSVGNFQKQIDAALDGDTIMVGNLDPERDFLQVETAVELFMQLLSNGNPGEVYNVCSGKPKRIGDLLTDMIRKSGKNLDIEISPKLLRENDISRIYGDRGKLDELLIRILNGINNV